jgi:hypothetical protein
VQNCSCCRQFCSWLIRSALVSSGSAVATSTLVRAKSALSSRGGAHRLTASRPSPLLVLPLGQAWQACRYWYWYCVLRTASHPLEMWLMFACGASHTSKNKTKCSNIALGSVPAAHCCSQIRTLCPLLSAASSGAVQGPVPAAQCSQIRALCPLLSATSSGLSLCPLLSAAKSGLCARYSVQPVQDSVSAKQALSSCAILSAISARTQSAS